MSAQIFFDGWPGVLRAVILVLLGYVTLVVFLRGFGKRALSKLNAFDWAVTVAIGSTLATTALSKSVALAEGLAVFATLLLAQFAVSWRSVRSGRFRRVVRAEPTVLFRNQAFDEKAMRSERITQDEVLQAVRSSGGTSLDDALVVILQTDGSLAAILKA